MMIFKVDHLYDLVWKCCFSYCFKQFSYLSLEKPLN